MLGPLLFIIFINNIDNCSDLIVVLLKFADDTKIGNGVRTLEQRENLQICLNKLTEWATT